MFEKEAEEIAKDIYIHHFDDDVNYPDVLKAITVGVQKGSEFGYNKANEELKEIIRDLIFELVAIDGEQVEGLDSVKKAKQFFKEIKENV